MESQSGESSPLSWEIECDHRQPPRAAAKVKLMCSYGGRILPRPHDNQISYVGGETKILAVDRSICFPAFLARAAALAGGVAAGEVLFFKYQLPGEDLDALISVTDDEDLDHMMTEYDRLVRHPARPSPRLRLFLFVTSSAAASPTAGPQPKEQKKKKNKKAEQRQWFEDALSSPLAAPIYTVPATPSVPGPDFLFGLDKDSVPATDANVEPEPEIVSPPAPAVVSPSSSEFQKQIEELHQLQITAENHQELQRQQIAASEIHHQQQQQQIAASENHYQQKQQIAASENHHQQQQIAASENHHQQQQIAASENHYQQQQQIAASENHQQQQQIAASDNHQQKQQITASENQQQQQQQAPMQQNGSSDDVLATAARVPAGDYYMKAGLAAVPAGHWPEQQKAGNGCGEQQQAVYLIPAAPGMFRGYPGAYYAAVPQMTAEVGRPAAGAYQVAYDSAGRAVYYARAVVPTYQMEGPMSAGDSKPAQAS